MKRRNAVSPGKEKDLLRQLEERFVKPLEHEVAAEAFRFSKCSFCGERSAVLRSGGRRKFCHSCNESEWLPETEADVIPLRATVVEIKP